MGGSSDSTSNTASNTASNQATNFASQGAQASASNTQQNYAQNTAANTAQTYGSNAQGAYTGQSATDTTGAYSGQSASNTTGAYTGQTNANATSTSTSGPVEAALKIIQDSMGPISNEQIQNYISPYLQSVVQSTTAQQQQNNAVQQQALKGNAISQNALGGDRSRIAQAELMRGQGLNDASVIANLYDTGYSRALASAQADRAAQLQAASMMGTQTTGTSATQGTQSGTSQQATQGTQAGVSQQATQGTQSGTSQQGTQGYSNSATNSATAGTSASATNSLSETAMQGAQASAGTGASSGNTNSTTTQNMGLGQMIGLGMSGFGMLADGGAVSVSIPKPNMQEMYNLGKQARSGLAGMISSFADGGTPVAAVAPQASAAMPNVTMPTLSSPTVSLPAMYAPTVGSGGGGKGSLSGGGGKGSQSAPETPGVYEPGSMVGPTVPVPNVPQVSVPQAQAADSGGKGSGGAVRGYADGGGTEIDFSQLGLGDVGGIPADSPYIMDEAKQTNDLGALKDASFSQAWDENPMMRPAGIRETIAGISGDQPSSYGQQDVKAPGISVSPSERPSTWREALAGYGSLPAASPDVPQMDPGQSNSLAGLAALNAPETPLNPAEISTDVVRNNKGGLGALGNMPPIQETQVPERPVPAQAEVTARAPAVGGKQAVVQTIVDELRAGGASDSAIRGIMANVKDESAFNPTLRHFDQPSPRFRGTEAQNAHGLYQIGGEEWNKFDGWMKKNHPDANWQDPKLQTQFMAENLQQNYPKVWKQMNEGTPEEAAQAYNSGYLRPAKRHEMARNSQYASGVPELDSFVADAVGKIKSGAGALVQGAQDAGEGIAEGLGGLKKGIRNAVTRGFESESADHPYKGKADRETGGILKQLFGIEFNPLGLTGKQRMTMLHVGAALATNGNVGQGIKAGLNYQSGLNKESRQATLDAMKLKMQFAQLAQPKVIGETTDPATGAVRKQYGTFDMSSGQYIPAQTAGTPQANYLDPALSAGEAVKEAPPVLAAMAKKFANYELPAPGGAAMRNPQTMAALSLAEKINPGFSQQDYKAQQAMKTSFGSGMDSRTNASMGQALMHLETLDKSIDGLNNSRFPMWNQLSNAASTNFGNERFQKAAQSFNTAKIAVTEELTKAFKGTGGTLSEVQNWEKLIGDASSPAQLKEAVKQATALLEGRMEVQADKKNRVLHTSDTGYDLLPPKGKAAYDKITGSTETGNLQAARPDGVSRVEQARQQMQNTSTAPQRTPSIGAVYKGYRFKGGDPSQQANWEAAQ